MFCKEKYINNTELNSTAIEYSTSIIRGYYSRLAPLPHTPLLCAWSFHVSPMLAGFPFGTLVPFNVPKTYAVVWLVFLKLPIGYRLCLCPMKGVPRLVPHVPWHRLHSPCDPIIWLISKRPWTYHWTLLMISCQMSGYEWNASMPQAWIVHRVHRLVSGG